MTNNAFIVLENGMVFEGKSFGASGDVIGEMVFTTAMTGYLETLTDPSYYGQVVLQTFPLIGNYGIIPEDFESAKPHLRAYIVRDYCDNPSNFRSVNNIDLFLKSQGIIGVYDVDTRALTRIIRESGVMNAKICMTNPRKGDGSPEAALVAEIRAHRIIEPVQKVTCADIHTEKPAEDIQISCTAKPKKVVLWDFGTKANIRRELLKRNCTVITVPAHTGADEIARLKPDGIMLSNGPGDPAENTAIIAELQKVAALNIPLFGICLGHQLLALSQGMKTEKLKYGHRGENQPVKQLETGRVFISSQNHGYAVINESIGTQGVLSFINVNDNTCEGIRYTHIPAFSVQFHPEASAGPLDTEFLFDEFMQMMEGKNGSK